MSMLPSSSLVVQSSLAATSVVPIMCPCLTRVDCLPPELLCHTFEMLVCPVLDYKSFSIALSLSHVCRYWRHVAISCQHLWSRIVFACHDSYLVRPNCISLCLDRAHSVPLYVSLSLFKVNSRKIPKTAPTFYIILSRLLSAAPRWRALHLKLRCGRQLEPHEKYLMNSFRSGAFRSLWVLILEGWRVYEPDAPQGAPDLTFANLPSLRASRIYDCRPGLELPWDKLGSLYCDSEELSCKALQNAPHLRLLQLTQKNAEHVSMDRSITRVNNSIRHLNITSAFLPSCIPATSMPSLQTLVYKEEHVPLRQPFTSLFRTDILPLIQRSSLLQELILAFWANKFSNGDTCIFRDLCKLSSSVPKLRLLALIFTTSTSRHRNRFDWCLGMAGSAFRALESQPLPFPSLSTLAVQLMSDPNEIPSSEDVTPAHYRLEPFVKLHHVVQMRSNKALMHHVGGPSSNVLRLFKLSCIGVFPRLVGSISPWFEALNGPALRVIMEMYPSPPPRDESMQT